MINPKVKYSSLFIYEALLGGLMFIRVELCVGFSPLDTAAVEGEVEILQMFCMTGDAHLKFSLMWWLQSLSMKRILNICSWCDTSSI